MTGSAGQLFRLYQSAFNRASDTLGAGFWRQGLNAGLIANGYQYTPFV